MVNISIIAAMARNRAIGLRGDIPWYIPDDLKRFKALTLGHPCIMGRKTFESIMTRLGKPLPGRTSIVISRSGYTYPGVIVVPDIHLAIDEAFKISKAENRDQIFVIGGAEIYALALPFANRLYITEVDLEPEADAFMPIWRNSEFMLISREDHAGPPVYQYLDYGRR